MVLNTFLFQSFQSDFSSLFLRQHGRNAHHVKAIAGGSCICYCKGRPERLSLQDLIDNLIPCIIASTLQVPVYLYFQSYESDLMADCLKFDPKRADYPKMKEFLLNGLNSVLRLLDYSIPKILVLDTSAPKIKEIVDLISLCLKTKLPINHLYGLYGVVRGSDYPKGKPEENLMIEVYYRNLALYQMDFFYQLGVSMEDEILLFVENESQENAILVAGVDTVESRLDALIYPVTPNRQMKEMCLGNRNHKIELRSTEQQVTERSRPLDDINSPTYTFYRSIFRQFSISEVMKAWKETLVS